MLIFLISLFLLVLFFLLTALKVQIQYRLEGPGFFSITKVETWFVFAGLSLKVSLLRNPLLIFFRNFFKEIDNFFRKIWSADKKGDIEKGIGAGQKALRRLKDYLTFFLDRELLHILSRTLKIRCLYLFWRTEYGLGDPAYTAVFNGLIWTLKGMLIHLLDDLVYFEDELLLDVEPDFHDFNFSTSFCGIFFLPLGNIILTISRLFLHRIRSSIKKRFHNVNQVI